MNFGSRTNFFLDSLKFLHNHFNKLKEAFLCVKPSDGKASLIVLPN